MSMNILNDISAVYLQQVAEKKDDSYLEKDMKKRHENNEKAREEMKRTKANKDMVKAARKSMGVEDDDDDDDINEAVKGVDTGMRKAASAERRSGDKRLAPSKGKGYADQQKQSIAYMDKVTKKNKNVVGLVTKEALDPVGKEDSDIDNDGDTDSSDKYLHKRRKAIGKAMKKEKMKESFSNWRQDLAEVMGDVESNKEVKEKKVNNKIKINPEMKEAVEELGGELIEMVELDEKALSKQQQKFMGMVYAVKKGEMKAPSPEVAKAAAGMSKKSARDFAKTKHKGLPQVKEDVLNEREHDEPGEGPRQKYGDMRGIDRGTGNEVKFGGKWQSKERKEAGAAALAKLKSKENGIREMEEPTMEPSQDKTSDMQKKKIQVQKVRDLTTRLQAARKGVY
jgi:hypothetical protein